MMPQLFVVRRCDGFYRFWHDVTAPAPLQDTQVAYQRLTLKGTIRTTPDDDEYYDIFMADPLPDRRDGSEPLIRRLHPHDITAIESHLLRLDAQDRRLRFFRAATDNQIRDYVRSIDWQRSWLTGAIQHDGVVGIGEALFDRALSPRHAEIAVSVDLALRGCGLGRLLVGRAVARARILGVPQTDLSFLRENRPIQRIIRGFGGSVDMEDLVGVIDTGMMHTGPAGPDHWLAA